MSRTHEERQSHFDTIELNENKLTITEGYDERPVSWFKEFLLPDLLKAKDRLNLGENILDVGCSYGYFSKILTEYFQQVTAIDFAPTRIKLAIEHNTVPNITYHAIDIVREDIPGNYSSAISSAVYQHIDPTNGDRKKAFETTFKTLPSGGYLVLYDESFDVRPHVWDGFYTALSPQWIKENLSDLCSLEEFEEVAKGRHGETEFRYALRKN